MSVWASIEIFSILLYVLFLYFIYVFVEKKDATTVWKCIALTPLIISIFISPTTYNLTGYDIQECIAIENPIYQEYFRIVKIVFAVWIILLAIKKYIQSDKVMRKEILLLGTGILIFILSFFVSGYIAEQTELFVYEAIGLFGMVLFIGFLGYLIVNFKVFNIKLIATEALVVTLIFLTGASLFNAKEFTDLLLTGSIFIFICCTGYFLTKSVKREIEQREKIEKLAGELSLTNDQLKELDRQKDGVLHMVAHQLNGPVTTINTLTELLLDGTFGEMSGEQRENIENVRAASQKMGAQSSMVLDAAKIRGGKLPLKAEPIELGSFFKDILKEAEIRAQSKQVQLTVSLPSAQLPTVMLDRKYTQLAFDNLLSNAIKYTALKGEGGKVTFEVTIHEAKLRCVVKDSGVGIPKKDQGHIFKELYRASNAGKEGNGLGLNVALGAIQAQEGKIWFESEEGKGTTFYVELPLKPANEAGGAVAVKVEPAEKPAKKGSK